MTVNIYNFTPYSTLLSIIGTFLVLSLESEVRLYGFAVWIVSNLLWVIYFYKTDQGNPAILFTVYLFMSIVGVINNFQGVF